MSLQRTPNSGAIVKQRLPFSTSDFAALVAGDYALPPLQSPLSAAINAVALNNLSLAAYAVKMQNNGAVVSLEVKNRVASGVPADLVQYRVAKLPANADFSGAPLVPTYLAPGDLEITVAGTDTAQKRASIAINDAAAASFLDGEYLVVIATVPAPGPLTASPTAVDVQIEFFNSN